MVIAGKLKGGFRRKKIESVFPDLLPDFHYGLPEFDLEKKSAFEGSIQIAYEVGRANENSVKTFQFFKKLCFEWHFQFEKQSFRCLFFSTE